MSPPPTLLLSFFQQYVDFDSFQNAKGDRQVYNKKQRERKQSPLFNFRRLVSVYTPPFPKTESKKNPMETSNRLSPSERGNKKILFWRGEMSSSPTGRQNSIKEYHRMETPFFFFLSSKQQKIK